MPDELNTPPETPLQQTPIQRGHAPNLAQVDEPGGFSRIALRIVAAAIVVGLLIASYFYLGQRKAVATGDVARISLFPIQSVMSGQSSAPGMAGQDEHYDQLIVFAQVHVHNQSPEPLTILELQGKATLADATESESLAASPNDSTRLFGAYPQLAPLRMDPLLRHTVIAPGQTVEGLLIFNYSMTKTQWEQRKQFDVSVSFSNGTVIHIDGTHA